MFYTQVEVQENADGIRGAIPYVFDDINTALAKHYAVLSTAALSDLPYHASFVMGSDGVVVESRVFSKGGLG